MIRVRIRLAAGMAVALAAISTVRAQDPPDVTELLASARTVHQAVRSAHYRAHFELRIQGREDAYTRDGEVWFVKHPPPKPPPPPPRDDDDADVIKAVPMMPLTGPRSELGANVRIALDDGTIAAFDGQTTYQLLPHLKKLTTASLADGGERFITGNLTGNLVETPLLQGHRLPAPGEGALNYVGEETVGGVACHVLEYRAADTDMLSDQLETIWLGKDDLLMRRRDTRYVVGSNSQREQWEITDLAVGVDVDDALFVVEAPEGYETEIYTPPPPSELLADGAKAPDWTLKDAAGNEHSLSDFAGNVVVLDFWGTWCGPCLQAMPAIQKVHESFKDRGVVVAGISCRERAGADPAGLMREKGYTYLCLLNGDDVARQYQVRGYPTMYIVDGDGRIAEGHVGFGAELEQELAHSLEQLLADG